MRYFLLGFYFMAGAFTFICLLMLAVSFCQGFWRSFRKSFREGYWQAVERRRRKREDRVAQFTKGERGH